MKLASEYQHFQKATDSRYMQAFFARQLPQFSDSPEQIEVYIPRVSMRHGTHFIIQYLIHAVADDNRTGKAQIMCGYLPVSGAADSHQLDPDQTLVDAATGLQVPRFPHDPDLPELGHWVDPSRVARQIEGVTGQSPSGNAGQPVTPAEVEVLAYRLGRRCTLGITLAAGAEGIVAKIMRRRALEQALAADAHLRSVTSSGARSIQDALPRLLGASRDSGVLLMERAPGRSLHDLWATDGAREACGDTGRLLASCHAMSPGPGSVRTPRTEWDALETQLGQICTIFPELRSVWEEAKVPLQNHMPTAAPPEVQVHGDFYDKQVLFAPEQATLLDYDALGRGDPAMDVGNFMAHAELRKMQDPESALRIETGMVDFQLTYSESGARWPEAVRWWKAMTLSRLAGLYALRPRWRQLSQPLLWAAVETTETVQNDA